MVSPVLELDNTHPCFRTLEKIEEIVLCILLLGMIGLASSQIFLRNVLSDGLLWADAFLRYLVLWTGLLGAVSATGKGKHIALDITGSKIPQRISAYIHLVVYLFCLGCAGGLTWASWLFVLGEKEFGGPGPLDIPLWLWNGIFPVSFGLIFLKYILLILLQFRNILLDQNPSEAR